jgi:hypothetical protein
MQVVHQVPDLVAHPGHCTAHAPAPVVADRRICGRPRDEVVQGVREAVDAADVAATPLDHSARRIVSGHEGSNARIQADESLHFAALFNRHRDLVLHRRWGQRQRRHYSSEAVARARIGRSARSCAGRRGASRHPRSSGSFSAARILRKNAWFPLLFFQCLACTTMLSWKACLRHERGRSLKFLPSLPLRAQPDL